MACFLHVYEMINQDKSLIVFLGNISVGECGRSCLNKFRSFMMKYDQVTSEKIINFLNFKLLSTTCDKFQKVLSTLAVFIFY